MPLSGPYGITRDTPTASFGIRAFASFGRAKHGAGTNGSPAGTTLA
jgi:hypothetical protein